jgi:hypothetical protein
MRIYKGYSIMIVGNGHYERALLGLINLSVSEMICGRRQYGLDIEAAEPVEWPRSQYKFQSFHKINRDDRSRDP